MQVHRMNDDVLSLVLTAACRTHVSQSLALHHVLATSGLTTYQPKYTYHHHVQCSLALPSLMDAGCVYVNADSTNCKVLDFEADVQ